MNNLKIIRKQVLIFWRIERLQFCKVKDKTKNKRRQELFCLHFNLHEGNAEKVPQHLQVNKGSCTSHQQNRGSRLRVEPPTPIRTNICNNNIFTSNNKSDLKFGLYIILLRNCPYSVDRATGASVKQD